MKNKKKIIIIIVIILLMIGLSIFWPIISNFFNKLYIDNIKYDICITKIEEFVNMGGYATTSQYRLINISEKKLYIIKNYDVYGNASFLEKGDHYTVKSKDLTDDQIEKVKKLYNNNLDYLKSDEIVKINNTEIISGDYYIIEYNNEKIKLRSLPFEDDLW